MILGMLFGFSLLPLIALFHPGLPITHDGQDHVARIANFFLSLSEGNIVPRWAGNLNWGYGHPILMFLYPLPSYIASFFKFIGFSFVDSTKMVFGTTFIASVLAMYLWANAVWGKKVGFIAALLYGFAPYRFVDLYVRGAIGEHVAFIFPPLIMYCIYKMAKNRQYWYFVGLSLAVAFLILSHNAISIMFLPIFGAYILYLYFTEAQKNKTFLIVSFLSIVFGFFLSAFFWVPAFFEGKYTLRDIVTKGSMIDRFVPWSWFFLSPWNYGQGNEFTKSIGLVQWFGIACAVFSLIVTKAKKIRAEIIGLLVLFVTSLFFMTSQSSFIWKNVSLLQKFQFPWRILTVTVFSSSVLAALGYVRCTRLHSFGNLVFLKKHIDVVILVFFILALTYGMWQPKGYLVKPESYYSGVYFGTTDTGESSPIWSVRFMEHTYANPLEVIDGSVQVKEVTRSSTRHEYTVSSDGSARLVENTLFFPGWKIMVDDVQAGLQFQDPAFRGLMTFRVTEGNHKISVLFGETKLRLISDIISGVSWLVILIIGVWRSVVWIQRKRILYR